MRGRCALCRSCVVCRQLEGRSHRPPCIDQSTSSRKGQSAAQFRLGSGVGDQTWFRVLARSDPSGRGTHSRPFRATGAPIRPVMPDPPQRPVIEGRQPAQTSSLSEPLPTPQSRAQWSLNIIFEKNLSSSLIKRSVSTRHGFGAIAFAKLTKGRILYVARARALGVRAIRISRLARSRWAQVSQPARPPRDALGAGLTTPTSQGFLSRSQIASDDTDSHPAVVYPRARSPHFPDRCGPGRACPPKAFTPSGQTLENPETDQDFPKSSNGQNALQTGKLAPHIVPSS